MLTVTEAAKEELRRLTETRVRSPHGCLRLVTPPQWVGEGDFGIGIDEEREGDYAVEHQGVKVVVLDLDLSERLSRAVLDFKGFPGGAGFTLDVY